MKQDPMYDWLVVLARDLGAAALGGYAGYHASQRVDPSGGQHGAAVFACVNIAVQSVFKKVVDSGRSRPSEAEARAMLKERMDLIFLVRGTDEGRAAWHYVRVYSAKHDAFRRKLATGSLDVSEYGVILYSGWGKDPPVGITRAMEEEYGVSA